MNSKSLLILLAVLFTVTTFGQTKVFQFNEIQCRNKQQKWDKPKKTEDRIVYISDDSIDLTLDIDYHLTIVTTTLLPDNGAIYLCKDGNQNQVTVTLVNDEKLFLYASNKRFQVNFNASGISLNTAFADTED